MGLFAVIPLHILAVATSESMAAGVMQSYVSPIIGAMCIFASLVCTFFLINGGYHYMTSSGNPDGMQHAKKVIRNAVIGLVIVLSAAAFTAILAHSYGNPSAGVSDNAPVLPTVSPGSPSVLEQALNDVISGVMRDIIGTLAAPLMTALTYFTSHTQLMAANPTVLKLWLAIVGITDAIFVLVIALLGFHVMSHETFGLDEIEFKHLLPQIGIVFLLCNTSLFLIDGIISFSNEMISALSSVFPTGSVWDTLLRVTTKGGGVGIAELMITVAFLIVSIVLILYYIGRIVTLYIGAILSPLIFLLWLVPGFRDFAQTAAKIYLAIIFVLFIHVVILQLAASLFSTLVTSGPGQVPNALMPLFVGLATVLALLKTQGILLQLSYISGGPKSARILSRQLMNGVNALSSGGSRASSSIDRATRPRLDLVPVDLTRRANGPFSESDYSVAQHPKNKSSDTSVREHSVGFKGSSGLNNDAAKESKKIPKSVRPKEKK